MTYTNTYVGALYESSQSKNSQNTQLFKSCLLQANYITSQHYHISLELIIITMYLFAEVRGYGSLFDFVCT